MRRLFLIGLIALLLGPLMAGPTQAQEPSKGRVNAPIVPTFDVTVLDDGRVAVGYMLVAAPLPNAYPGNKIQWDQPVADAAEAAIIRHTMAWDGGAKTDLTTSTCTAFVSATIPLVCTYPIPATTTFATHSVVLTAFKIVDAERYESVGSVPFDFVYAPTPTNPPVPSGCRIVK